AQPCSRLLKGDRELLAEGKLPVAYEPALTRAVQGNLKIMRSRNLANVSKERIFPMVCETKAEIVIQALGMRLATHCWQIYERFDFRGKRETVSSVGIVQGFNAKVIACQYELTCLRIEKRKGEHPDQLGQRLSTPMGISPQ